MALGVEVTEMGWDLSLRAQSRRAAVMTSVWLREERDGKPKGDGKGRKNLVNHMGKNSMLDQALTDMEHDLEDGVLIGEERKKRAKGRWRER
ncbi:hypothetical protein GOBAR_DD10126 [Gossypium barbadense]|nr:hypothetical protein GOBAR_DD10126 [Gossypium barbadense]